MPMYGLTGAADCKACWRVIPYRADLLCTGHTPLEEQSASETGYLAGRKLGAEFRKLVGLPELTNSHLSETQVVFAAALGKGSGLHLALVQRADLTVTEVWQNRFVTLGAELPGSTGVSGLRAVCGQVVQGGKLPVAVQKVEECTCVDCGFLQSGSDFEKLRHKVLHE